MTSHELFIAILKTVVPRRSNRRPDGTQPRKQHSDRALSLMLLGDFETAGFAGSKRRLRSSSASPPQLAGDCGVWHGKKSFSLATFHDYSEFNESQVLQGNYGSASFRLHILHNQVSHVQRAVDPDNEGHFDVARVGWAGDEVDVAGLELAGFNVSIVVIHSLARTWQDVALLIIAK